jgi:hypothetical protein
MSGKIQEGRREKDRTGKETERGRVEWEGDRGRKIRRVRRLSGKET